jgi:hypothetical protein
MNKIGLSAGVFATTLLQACMSPPKVADKPVEPVFRVNHSPELSAETHYQLGRYHQERGHLDLARDAFTRAIGHQEKDLHARNALAAVYAQQGRYDEAKDLLRATIDRHPDAPQTYNNLGYVHHLEGSHKLAISYFERALQLNQNDERARNNLAAAATAVQGAPIDTPAASVTVRPVPAPSLASALPAEPPQARAPDLLAPQAQSQLVQLAPNVYELRMNRVAAAAAAPAAAAVAAPDAAPQAQPARIQVANGNGVTNMARQVRGFLGRHGIPVESLANLPPFRQQETQILYRQGHEPAAKAVHAALRGHATLVPTTDLPARFDVRLVLGQQSVSQRAWLDAPEAQGAVLVGDAAVQRPAP